MTTLSPDQRNYYYLIESARVGIHQPILAALYAVHSEPSLLDGETGLGLAPMNQVSLAQLNAFPHQVYYAANTIRSLTDALIAEGWQGTDLWETEAGRYSDRFLEAVANGYIPTQSAPGAAQLEPCGIEGLRQAYLADLETDDNRPQPPANLTDLDPALLAFAAGVPAHYHRLNCQQQALIELVRIWRKLDSVTAVLEALAIANWDGTSPGTDPDQLDLALVKFLSAVLDHYSGYPYQREALIRLVQLWRQLDSRAAAITWVLDHEPWADPPNLEVLDPALIAFVQRLPVYFQGRGEQRLALTEGYRAWYGLDSRAAAIQQLGVDPDFLAAHADHPETLRNSARQIDLALLAFFETVPSQYRPTEPQRQALIQLVQFWRRLEGPTATIQSLLEDRRHLERAGGDDPDAMPAPKPLPLARRPQTWTVDNLQLAASMIPNGHFTWAEATQGGLYLPPNQATVAAMVRMAELAQQACDRIGRPFRIIRWYQPATSPPLLADPLPQRHSLGDTITFYCPGLTGQQVYWALDPWWPGGLGRYARYPALLVLDGRREQARWTV